MPSSSLLYTQVMRDSTGALSSLAEAAKCNSQAHHVEFVSPKEGGRSVSSSCKVDLYWKSFPYLTPHNVIHLNGGQCVGSAETGTLGLLAVHAAGGVCSTEGKKQWTKTHHTKLR